MGLTQVNLTTAGGELNLDSGGAINITVGKLDSVVLMLVMEEMSLSLPAGKIIDWGD